MKKSAVQRFNEGLLREITFVCPKCGAKQITLLYEHIEKCESCGAENKIPKPKHRRWKA